MLASKIKEIRNGRVIVKDAVMLGYQQIGEHKGFAIFYDENTKKAVAVNHQSNSSERIPIEFPMSSAAEALQKIKGLLDYRERTKIVDKKTKDIVDPTKPKNIAAAKNLSKAQGQAALDSKGC